MKEDNPYESSCEVIFCEDENGNVIVRRSEKCPPGYYERFRRKIAKKGKILFEAVDIDEVGETEDEQISPEEWEEFKRWKEQQRRKPK